MVSSPHSVTVLDGDMWASQLLTLQTTTGVRVLFDFTGTQSYVGFGRVEVCSHASVVQ